MPASSALVTGGRGFVGAWLCRELLGSGHRVVSLDRALGEGRPSALALLGIEDQVTEVEGDLLDAELLLRTLTDHQVSAVFHLAAQTLVGTAAASPAATFETNVRGTWAVLEACREHRVERVVVASSDKAYGAHDELPYREDFALRPTAPYESSKAAADLIARSYWPSYGLPVAVTRFANVYGGGGHELLPAHPGGGQRHARRPPAGASLRRLAGARLPLRRGRGPRLPGDRRRPGPRRGSRPSVQRGRRSPAFRWARSWS